MPVRQPTSVRFLRQWRGYAPGKVSDQLGRGVASLLVQRGIAQWESAELPLARHVGARKRKKDAMRV